MSDKQDSISKTVLAKQQQAARISAVNNWRGQCLDNFARAEYAIIRCSEAILEKAPGSPFKLEEAARNRTRILKNVLEEHWPKSRSAAQLAVLLDHWSIREKERNPGQHFS